MSELRLGVTGATGRMGREVIAAATGRGHEVVLAVNRAPTPNTVDGIAIEPADDLASLLAERAPDVLIDFTGPESANRYAAQAAAAGVGFVTGTTGFDDDADLRRAADSVPVLRAANFSRGIQALDRALQAALAALPGYDIELTETHHNAKVDAPSGTAMSLLATIDEQRGNAGERVHGRAGNAPRRAGEIGVHARRAGDIAGEHELLLAGNDEVIELTHRAGDRGVFAAGALDAAEWLAGRDPGYYEFSDVIDER